MRKFITKLIYKLGYQREMIFGIDYKYVNYIDDREQKDNEAYYDIEVGIVITRGLFKSVFFTFNPNVLFHKKELVIDIHSGKEIIDYWGKWGNKKFEEQIKSIGENIIKRNTITN